MFDQQDVVAYCLSLPETYEDHPFHDDTAVMRHRANKKSFALLICAHGKLHVNLKCDPLRADLLRQVYPDGVVPAYHMNKVHWNSVFLKAGVPDEEIVRMIEASYDLTRPRFKRKQR